MPKNWYLKWEHHNRNKKDVATMRSKLGWSGYGIYAAVREIIAEFEGEAPIDVIMNDLHISFEDIQPLFDVFCYDFVMRLLSEKTLKSQAKQRADISEKRSEAGRIGMAKRWGKKPAKSTRTRVSRQNKNEQDDLFQPEQLVNDHEKTDKKDAITNVIHINSKNSYVNDKSFTSQESKKITIVMRAESIYNDWYKSQSGVEPIFSVAGRTKLKMIISYLRDQIEKSNTHPPEKLDDIALNAWETILKNKKYWGKFEQEKIKITQIHSNLENIILNIKKHARSNGQQSIGDHSQNGIESRIAGSLSAIANAEI
jgi:hypothetical protein